MPRRKALETAEAETDPATAVAPETPRRPRVTAVVKRSDIISRRLANPMGGGNRTIPAKLKDRDGKPLVEFYIADRTLRPDFLHEMISVNGWEYAGPEDIDGKPEDFGFDQRDGRLVRGERGNEVLLKMSAADRRDVLMAKDAWNRRQTLGAKATKQAIVERASAELGDQPASFLDSAISNVEVKDTLERIPGEAGEWESVKPA